MTGRAKLAALALFLLAPFPAAALDVRCAGLLAGAETRHGIPAGLLRLMAEEEAGHPFALNDRGQAIFPVGVEEAKAVIAARLAAARSAGRRNGRPNLDVGCMQVNLFWHPGADPYRLLEPGYNVDYAAAHLSRLRARPGVRNWTEAAALYHSETQAALQRGYVCRLLARLPGRPDPYGMCRT